MSDWHKRAASEIVAALGKINNRERDGLVAKIIAAHDPNAEMVEAMEQYLLNVGPTGPLHKPREVWFAMSNRGNQTAYGPTPQAAVAALVEKIEKESKQ